MAPPARVLLVYADRVGAAMGGMGIRAVELGRVLREALGAEVAIAAAAADEIGRASCRERVLDHV